jgi:hypothetical protein
MGRGVGSGGRSCAVGGVVGALGTKGGARMASGASSGRDGWKGCACTFSVAVAVALCA